jgi:hypothetical protein
VSSATPIVADADDDNDITGTNVVFVSMLPKMDQSSLPALPLTSTNTAAKALTKNIEIYLPHQNDFGVSTAVQMVQVTNGPSNFCHAVHSHFKIYSHTFQAKTVKPAL